MSKPVDLTAMTPHVAALLSRCSSKSCSGAKVSKSLQGGACKNTQRRSTETAGVAEERLPPGSLLHVGHVGFSPTLQPGNWLLPPPVWTCNNQRRRIGLSYARVSAVEPFRSDHSMCFETCFWEVHMIRSVYVHVCSGMHVQIIYKLNITNNLHTLSNS